MDSTKYIILHSSEILPPARGDMGRAHRTELLPLEAAQPIVKLEEAELTKREVNDLRRDPRTLAIAKPMPLKLIEPVDSSSAATATKCWGIDAVRASESPYDGTGITVAVLDTGIDPNHPAFKGMKLVQKNFTEEADNDIHGHGTHCAGTIFGQDVNDIRIGIARNIKCALIGKVLGEEGGSTDTLARAIMWAVNEGANVISMSLGIDFPGYVDWLVRKHRMDVRPATSLALEEYRANVSTCSPSYRALWQHRGNLGNLQSSLLPAVTKVSDLNTKFRSHLLLPPQASLPLAHWVNPIGAILLPDFQIIR